MRLKVKSQVSILKSILQRDSSLLRIYQLLRREDQHRKDKERSSLNKDKLRKFWKK